MVVGSNGARQLALPVRLHEMIGRTPIAVAIEERATNAPVENRAKGDMVRLCLPGRDEDVTLEKAAQTKAFLIGLTAAKTPVLGSILLLK